MLFKGHILSTPPDFRWSAPDPTAYRRTRSIRKVLTEATFHAHFILNCWYDSRYYNAIPSASAPARSLSVLMISFRLAQDEIIFLYTWWTFHWNEIILFSFHFTSYFSTGNIYFPYLMWVLLDATRVCMYVLVVNWWMHHEEGRRESSFSLSCSHLSPSDKFFLGFFCNFNKTFVKCENHRDIKRWVGRRWDRDRSTVHHSKS